MSLDLSQVKANATSFPRVSGDEPVSQVRRIPPVTFSPRERG